MQLQILILIKLNQKTMLKLNSIHHKIIFLIQNLIHHRIIMLRVILMHLRIILCIQLQIFNKKIFLFSKHLKTMILILIWNQIIILLNNLLTIKTLLITQNLTITIHLWINPRIFILLIHKISLKIMVIINQSVPIMISQFQQVLTLNLILLMLINNLIKFMFLINQRPHT